MPYLKDSAIIVLQTTEDGYVASAYTFDQVPPPIGVDIFGTIEGRGGDKIIDRRWHISTSKTDLKNKLNSFVDNIFDTP